MLYIGTDVQDGFLAHPLKETTNNLMPPYTLGLLSVLLNNTLCKNINKYFTACEKVI